MKRTKQRKFQKPQMPMGGWPGCPDVGAPFIPTPEEIEAGCREFQEAWDEDEERRRRGWNSQAERVNCVQSSDLTSRRDNNKIGIN